MRFTHCAAFFVVRSKYNLHYRVLHVGPSSEALGVLKDEHIVLTGKRTDADYPVMLRRIEFFDAAQDRHITLLTNHFALEATTIARLYKSRWQVELFFKWIKQNLRIKAFVGTSPNAVKTQIWSAVCTYVLVAIVKKRLCTDASMQAIFQVLSLSLFETTPLQELLGQIKDDEQTPRQLNKYPSSRKSPDSSGSDPQNARSRIRIGSRIYFPNTVRQGRAAQRQAEGRAIV